LNRLRDDRDKERERRHKLDREISTRRSAVRTVLSAFHLNIQIELLFNQVIRCAKDSAAEMQRTAPGRDDYPSDDFDDAINVSPFAPTFVDHLKENVEVRCHLFLH